VRSGPEEQPATLDGLSDEELVERLRRRDEATFDALVRAWSPVMMRIARFHVRSRATAEEVVQEAWIGVIRGIDRFEGRAALRSWVLRICANIAKRHGIRESRVRPVGLTGEAEVLTMSAERFRSSTEEWAGYWTETGKPADWGPESRVLTGEVRTLLMAGLRQLPPRQAHVVALRDMHGLDSSEVAELVGTSEGNVRVLLHRGRAALRQLLEDYYIGGEVATR
jgi:RNA polymerase sigma-70 factor (ECF subfamily)